MKIEAILGYTLLAARSIKMSEKQIDKLFAAMSETLSDYTEEEAEEICLQDCGRGQ